MRTLCVRPGYHELEIRPCLPSAWERASVRRTFRGQDFLIEITRSASGEIAVTVNGGAKEIQPETSTLMTL